MITYKVEVLSDTATPEIQRLVAGLRPAQIADRIGVPLQRLTRDHLTALNNESHAAAMANPGGNPSTGFYSKFADQTRWIPTDSGCAVLILPALIQGRKVGIGLRVFGGTITPQTVSKLAIPISPLSYGHIPGDFTNLFLLKTATGAYLAQRGFEVSAAGRLRRAGHGMGGNAGRRLKADLHLLFKLVSSVTQLGDREVLPSDEEYASAAIAALKRSVSGNAETE